MNEIEKILDREYSHFHDLFSDELDENSWFIDSAIKAYQAGRYEVVKRNEKPFILRFWLHDVEENENSEISSSNSMLLHHFVSGDVDKIYHDHPWAYTSRILSGGYSESILPFKSDEFEESGILGMQVPSKGTWRKKGSQIERKANQIHTILEVLPHTWTLMSTSQKINEWGLWLPGQKWISAKDHFKKEEEQNEEKEMYEQGYRRGRFGGWLEPGTLG